MDNVMLLLSLLCIPDIRTAWSGRHLFHNVRGLKNIHGIYQVRGMGCFLRNTSVLVLAVDDTSLLRAAAMGVHQLPAAQNRFHPHR